jgi:hypothetical protein
MVSNKDRILYPSYITSDYLQPVGMVPEELLLHGEVGNNVREVAN